MAKEVGLDKDLVGDLGNWRCHASIHKATMEELQLTPAPTAPSATARASGRQLALAQRIPKDSEPSRKHHLSLVPRLWPYPLKEPAGNKSRFLCKHVDFKPWLSNTLPRFLCNHVA